MILYEFIKIPQSFFCSKKTTAPFTREPLTDSRKGCPYGLMYFSNLITAESSNIFANSFGGSKPRPTACDIILNFKITRNLYCKKQLNC